MAAAIKIGTIFAGYRIEGVLGRGGMGVVYLAEQPELRRRVAIKVIAPALASDPDYLQRFKRESRLAAAIEHPHLRGGRRRRGDAIPGHALRRRRGPVVADPPPPSSRPSRRSTSRF